MPLRRTLAERLEVYSRRVRLGRSRSDLRRGHGRAPPRAGGRAARQDRRRARARRPGGRPTPRASPPSTSDTCWSRSPPRCRGGRVDDRAAQGPAGRARRAPRRPRLRGRSGAGHGGGRRRRRRGSCRARSWKATRAGATCAGPSATRREPGLLAIARRLRATVDESFASFAAAWSGAAAAAFWDEAERVAASLRARTEAQPEEIERKYLLSGSARRTEEDASARRRAGLPARQAPGGAPAPGQGPRLHPLLSHGQGRYGSGPHRDRGRDDARGLRSHVAAHQGPPAEEAAPSRPRRGPRRGRSTTSPTASWCWPRSSCPTGTRTSRSRSGFARTSSARSRTKRTSRTSSWRAEGSRYSSSSRRRAYPSRLTGTRVPSARMATWSFLP